MTDSRLAAQASLSVTKTSVSVTRCRHGAGAISEEEFEKAPTLVIHTRQWCRRFATNPSGKERDLLSGADPPSSHTLLSASRCNDQVSAQFFRGSPGCGGWSLCPIRRSPRHPQSTGWRMFEFTPSSAWSADKKGSQKIKLAKWQSADLNSDRNRPLLLLDQERGGLKLESQNL